MHRLRPAHGADYLRVGPLVVFALALVASHQRPAFGACLALMVGAVGLVWAVRRASQFRRPPLSSASGATALLMAALVLVGTVALLGERDLFASSRDLAERSRVEGGRDLLHALLASSESPAPGSPAEKRRTWALDYQAGLVADGYDATVTVFGEEANRIEVRWDPAHPLPFVEDRTLLRPLLDRMDTLGFRRVSFDDAESFSRNFDLPLPGEWPENAPAE